MATKQARGTKRTCQSSECDARFYDLNRSPIVCPICGTVYELASSPLGAAAASEERSSRRGRKSDFAAKPASDEVAEGDEELEIEDGDEDDSISTSEDETFLEEEEEEGGDVSNIIGGSVKEGDEER
ncbi:MAG TPA: TIGR02300 family protein [Hyphomicrobium sp.]|nr:TIGR02300 family protein [Hyphomicrobium sp.]